MRHALVVLTISMAFAVSTAVAAQSRVLIPTKYGGPGAFGSRWAIRIIIDNLMDAPFSSPGVAFDVSCGIPEGCLADELPAGSAGGLQHPAAPTGLLLYLPSDDAEVFFSGRFSAAPRNPLFSGTELPIVREREFRRGATVLPDVPFPDATNPFRTTLRIYGIDALPQTAVQVELRHFLFLREPARFTSTVVLTVPPSPPGSTVPIFPAYAEINLRAAFPDALGGPYNVTVVPLPLSGGEIPKIWAFATIVDNRTQEVTVQRPQ